MVHKFCSYLHLLCTFQTIQGPQKVKVGSDKVVTAQNIIIATGSVPFVPKGIEVDGVYHFLLILFMVSLFSFNGSSVLLDGGHCVPVFYYLLLCRAHRILITE